MTAIGALGGATEVILMQPMVGIKNALQEGRPIPTNVAHLYRGLPVRQAATAVLLRMHRNVHVTAHTPKLAADEHHQHDAHHRVAIRHQ